MHSTIDHQTAGPQSQPAHDTRRTVAIVGGGITGLTLALELKRRGFLSTVFEAGPIAGGNIRSSRFGDYLVEHGPHSLLTSTPILDLIGYLGLRDEMIAANAAVSQRFVVRGGRLRVFPTTPPAMLATRLLTWRAKLRVLFEPLVRARPDDVDESVAAFVRRRLGHEVLDYAVNPFVAGIFAGDPERLSLRHTLPRVATMEREHGSLSAGLMAGFRARRAKGRATPSDATTTTDATPPSAPTVISFRDGLQTLVDAISRALGSDLEVRTTVTSVHRRDDRWVVEAMATDRDEHAAARAFDAVVLAVPTHALSAMELPAALRKYSAPLESVEYPPVATVTMGFRRAAVRHPLNGFGFLVPAVERRAMLGTLFTSTLFPARAPEDHVAISSFVGGTRQPELATASTEATVAALLPDLATLLGVTEPPVFVKRVLWPRAIPQYTVGYDAMLEAAEQTEQANGGLYLVGNYRHGVSVGDCVTTANRTAERVAAYLARTN
ncbi:MAG: protoporphyrinogen oxidase [Gemmatimonadaceae bacterium]|jgi:oxygen-dependent protoporphyrinogen oxidase|nr:protoporphyrinogen oxidase [Gemmatimonadaceae bacterium]